MDATELSAVPLHLFFILDGFKQKFAFVCLFRMLNDVIC